MEDKVYYLSDLANELGVHFNTAYRYVKENKVKAVLIGNKYRISKEELDRVKKDGIPRNI